MAIRIAIAGCLLAFAGTTAAGGIEITEWEVPWPDTRPRDPYVGPEGLTWFVGQTGNYVASLDPDTGEFERYDLPEGAGPHNLIVDGEDGTIWYAGNRDAHIGRLDPATRKVQKFPMPSLAARDPHTLAFGHNDFIWFTVQGGNFVGRFDTGGGEIELIEVPTVSARPYGIVVAEDGRPWFTEFGTNKLGTIDPETLELEEVLLPRADARPRRLAITSDGLIWYVDYARGYLGRLDADSGRFEEWRVPGGEDGQPYGMAVDARDRLWFVETGSEPNRFVGFDPNSEQFVGGTDIESGGGTVRHMYFHEPTGSIWFGTDTNTIGRADVG